MVNNHGVDKAGCAGRQGGGEGRGVRGVAAHKGTVAGTHVSSVMDARSGMVPDSALLDKVRVLHEGGAWGRR